MGFFIAVFLIYTLLNVYLFWKGWNVVKVSPVLRGIYSAFFLFFYSAFFVAMLGRNDWLLALLKPLYTVGTIWLGALVYLILWFVVTDLLFLLVRLITKKFHVRSFRIFQFVTGYVLVNGVLALGYYQFTHPVVVEKEIVISKPGISPRDLKIVAFGDTHLGVQIDKKRLQQYVALINAQHPDLILFSGDLTDNSVRPLEEERMYEEINQLQAPMGIYACLGNHEYLSGIHTSLEFLTKTKMILLTDGVAHAADDLWIIGRDDRQGNPNRLSLDSLVKKADTNQAVILLDHEPYYLSQAVKNRIDLQISGHTHEGQIFPFNLIVDYIYEVGHGYKLKGNTSVVVTSGLGLWGPPFRIGTQSEIVVLNVHFRKKSIQNKIK